MNIILMSSLLGVVTFFPQVSTSEDPSIILRNIPNPVFIGHSVVLQCQYQAGNHNKTTFFKNGEEIHSYNSSSSERVINMTIENVTQANEGNYTCASQDGNMSLEILFRLDRDPSIILRIIPNPVFIGHSVVLQCQYQAGNHNKTTFFKNGEEIHSYNSSSSERVINMTIENVTQANEGNYTCASQDGNMSLEILFRLDQGSWKWIIVSCGVILLFFIPLTVLLFCHYRYQRFCTHSYWPVFKQEVPAVALPVTKQDVTEVQWDLPWMEMSSLMDKQLYCGT